MAIMKISIFIIAMTMALTITITMRATTQVEQKPLSVPEKIPESEIRLPSKRVSRFLASSNANPRATAIKCHKDNELCDALMGSKYKCCQNKCMDLSEDKHNCGSCKKHCKYTNECCRGQCVDTSYDKRHCGQCNNPCPSGSYCVYGQCNYAWSYYTYSIYMYIDRKLFVYAAVRILLFLSGWRVSWRKSRFIIFHAIKGPHIEGGWWFIMNIPGHLYDHHNLL